MDSERKKLLIFNGKPDNFPVWCERFLAYIEDKNINVGKLLSTSFWGKFSLLTMGTETGDERDTQEEAEDNGENDDSESQLSLSSSTHENEAPANTENGYSI